MTEGKWTLTTGKWGGGGGGRRAGTEKKAKMYTRAPDEPYRQKNSASAELGSQALQPTNYSTLDKLLNLSKLRFLSMS